MVDLLTRARDAAAAVTDPEIPVLTIADLGVLRDVTQDGDTVEVTITPTYTGCPAMTVIALEIETALARAGIPHCRVRTTLSPAWTTDWISEEGRRKLLEYGIAPPPVVGGGACAVAPTVGAGVPAVGASTVLAGERRTSTTGCGGHGKDVDGRPSPSMTETAALAAVTAGHRPACPHCGSRDTELLSAFGSTPCKSLHRCLTCREPFDAFKCH